MNQLRQRSDEGEKGGTRVPEDCMASELGLKGQNEGREYLVGPRYKPQWGVYFVGF